MENKYEKIREIVIEGTKRAIEKLKIEAEKSGRKLVVASDFESKK
jgi:hypothetical protein